MKSFLLVCILTSLLQPSFSLLKAKSTPRSYWESYVRLPNLKVDFGSLQTVSDQLSLVLKGRDEFSFTPSFSPLTSPNVILCASAKFKDLIKSTGWDFLSIRTSQKCDPVLQFWAAGLLEGLLTSQQISDFYLNLLDIHSESRPVFGKIKRFYSKVHESLLDRLKARAQKADDATGYWDQLILLQAQCDGLLAGYNHRQAEKLGIEDIYLLNGDGEIPELLGLFSQAGYFEEGGEKPPNRFKISARKRAGLKGAPGFLLDLFEKYKTRDLGRLWKGIEADSHCSAFVKLIKDGKGKIQDMLIAHSTWDHYSEMLRVYKDYEFELLETGKVKRKKVTFSSYPGLITSTDDFYIIDASLVVMETTLDVLDSALLSKVLKAQDYVPDFMRIMTACYISKTSVDWLNALKFLNTGTYNSQWMILDLNQIKSSRSKEKLAENSLIVAEQIPGSVFSKDMSAHLDSKGYWASYNVPYFDRSRTGTGFQQIAIRFRGQEFNYESNTRGRLFARYQPAVKDLQSLKDMMLTNNYLKEKGSAGDAIAARFDLDPSVMGKTSGAVDVKVTNLEMASGNTCQAISGPTWKELPAFSFENYPKAPKRGLPMKWQFEW